MFDTKVALIVRDDLAVWRKLHVVAFPATGIAAAIPEAPGESYEDAAHRQYGRMLGQPTLVFAADLPGLQAAHKQALSRELEMVPYVHAMFSTGHDAANREVFRAADTENLDCRSRAARPQKSRGQSREGAGFACVNRDVSDDFARGDLQGNPLKSGMPYESACGYHQLQPWQPWLSTHARHQSRPAPLASSSDS